EVSANNGYGRQHFYDSIGRNYLTNTQIGGVDYTTGTTYGSNVASADFARVKDIMYPSGQKLSYTYTPLGYTQKVVNPVNVSQAYWRAEEMDAQGQLLQQSYGNGIVTTMSFDPQTGQLKTIKAGTGTANQVQNA